MNFEAVLNKYGFTRKQFCDLYGTSTNNFDMFNNLINSKLKTIIKVHKITNIPYNELLGEQVFTPDNIDNQTDNTKHTSLSGNLVTIEENEIHLHPKFAEAIRKAIQDNKE